MSSASTTAVTRRAQEDSAVVRWTVIGLASAILTWLVVIPAVNVFYEAFANGPAAYWASLFDDPDTWSAITLTLTVAPVAVALNVVFGVAIAWAIAKFRFRGRTVLMSLIDLPFAVSPVVAGLAIVLIFGLQGYLGPWLREHDIKVIFATPGIILATAFVTLPFVARELIPLMEAIGSEEEVAAVSLGARGWLIFRRITLPNIKWGLLYGMILCNARAMGEFGAVYVVSGRITGQTDTLPLRVEKLFQEYDTQGSFAVASLLCSLALLTLFVKSVLEWKTHSDLASRTRALTHVDEKIESTPAPQPPLRLVHSAGRGAGSTEQPRQSREVADVGIKIEGITKRFGDFTALDNVSLEVPDGALLALLGPSGSGKTTLLRIIAGLESADSGTIHYKDEDTTHRSPRDRNVGFVFQHYALFRHMSVFENVAFGLRVRRWENERVAERVHELLKLIQLESLAKQSPAQLSGGQRQRVALARALAAEPKVLLLDEPFGALDAKVRQELRQWLRKLHDEIHVTSVFVTHDQEEAFEVADRVVVMSRGRIEQAGTPSDVFEHPANAFVMDFLGNVNVFHGRVESGRAVVGGMEMSYPEYPHEESRDVKAYVRPHELELARRPTGSTSLKAKVLRVNSAGPVVKVDLFAGDFALPLIVSLTPDRYAELKPVAGEDLFVFPKRWRVFADYRI